MTIYNSKLIISLENKIEFRHIMPNMPVYEHFILIFSHFFKLKKQY